MHRATQPTPPILCVYPPSPHSLHSPRPHIATCLIAATPAHCCSWGASQVHPLHLNMHAHQYRTPISNINIEHPPLICRLGGLHRPRDGVKEGMPPLSCANPDYTLSCATPVCTFSLPHASQDGQARVTLPQPSLFGTPVAATWAYVGEWQQSKPHGSGVVPHTATLNARTRRHAHTNAHTRTLAPHFRWWRRMAPPHGAASRSPCYPYCPYDSYDESRWVFLGRHFYPMRIPRSGTPHMTHTRCSGRRRIGSLCTDPAGPKVPLTFEFHACTLPTLVLYAFGPVRPTSPRLRLLPPACCCRPTDTKGRWRTGSRMVTVASPRPPCRAPLATFCFPPRYNLLTPSRHFVRRPRAPK
jgi:hypothetical protein